MDTKLDQCKSDLKQTWKLIYKVLGKNKKNTTSDAFIIDGKKTHDPNIIAARFNEFFINICYPPTSKNGGIHTPYRPGFTPLVDKKIQL